jgi:ubiquinone/menaquinone biosynthesis C-methylase UbiE
MTGNTQSQPAAPVTSYFEAERIERRRRNTYRPEFVPLLLDFMGARSGMRILDVGCGTGSLARLLARSLDDVQVVGLDADEEMLELARQMLEREKLADRVTLRQEDAQRLPFPDASFDLVTSHNLL